MTHVAFDIEIAREIPDGVIDWYSLGPLGISCAATLTDTGDLRLWHGYTDDKWSPVAPYAPQMSPAEVEELILYLDEQLQAGRHPVTWNGLGFDFRVLAQESYSATMAARCRALALGHIDMAFQMLCERGFMIGLDAAAKGLGLPGKTEGMNGAKAPVLWRQGRDAQNHVLDYVAQDVITTASVYEAIVSQCRLMWKARSGSRAEWFPTFQTAPTSRLLTAAEALKLPEPDTSWLREPWPRSKFADWTTEGRP